MAVLAEAISVIIKMQSIIHKFPGGWEEFTSYVPNKTLCADGEIIRVGFMDSIDVEEYINFLETNGLIYIDNNQARDIIVVDQLKGPLVDCHWIEFGTIEIGEDTKQKISACRITGSKIKDIVLPENWQYDKSLSKEYLITETEDIDRRMVLFERKDGLRKYFDLKSGKTLYVGRTKED
ncbi:MAG: hypothetical protein RBT56_08585 [Ignavibacteriaceae bacterium]|jgi:hypothetical protein|nr:hypothetical protein [Ignavibacteriaceae bacterium]